MEARGIGTGDWVAVATDDLTVLLPGQSAPAAAALWLTLDEASASGDPVEHVVRTLLADGFAQLDDLVVVHTGERVRVLARGGARVVVRTRESSQVLSADGRIWVDEFLDAVTGLEVALPGYDDESAVGESFALRPGISRVGGLRWDSEPAADSHSDSHSDADSESDTDAGTGWVDEATVLEPALGVAPAPAPEPEPQPDPEPEPEPAPAPEPEAQPEAVRPLVKGIDPGDAAGGETVPIVASPPAPAWQEDVTTHLPADDAPVEDSGEILPFERPRPSAVARLVFSHGLTLDVDRRLVIGRAPSDPEGGDGESDLITVPSPMHEVSGSHVEIRPEGGQAVVVDLGSTNGTMVHQPGSSPDELRPGVGVALRAGCVVDLGDGVTIKVTGV